MLGLSVCWHEPEGGRGAVRGRVSPAMTMQYEPGGEGRVTCPAEAEQACGGSGIPRAREGTGMR